MPGIRWIRILVLLSLASTLTAADALNPRENRPTEDAEVQRAAAFALNELQDLSDSGVYSTLGLHRIVSASVQDGVFHRNVFLELELNSPHYKSGKEYEAFDVMVMTHREDGYTNFAIDEFPEMDPNAVEEFWIEKVERRREEREAWFSKLEAEAAGLEMCEQDWGEGSCTPAAIAARLLGLSGNDLQSLLSGDEHDPRTIAAREVEKVLGAREGEAAGLTGSSMAELSTAELYAVVRDGIEGEIRWELAASELRRRTDEMLEGQCNDSAEDAG
ncbi:unnamed protein product [Chrysoparadoxa australica]